MKISDIKVSARCPRCGGGLQVSPVKGYAFYCSKCNEDFYTIELNNLGADFMINGEIKPLLELIRTP